MAYSNMTFEHTITLETEQGEEFDITLECSFIPGESDTYWEPGCPDEVEIIDIVDNDYPVDISYNEMWGLIGDYDEENNDKILEAAYEEIRGYEEERAEYLYEQWKDHRDF